MRTWGSTAQAWVCQSHGLQTRQQAQRILSIAEISCLGLNTDAPNLPYVQQDFSICSVRRIADFSDGAPLRLRLFARRYS